MEPPLGQAGGVEMVVKHPAHRGSFEGLIARLCEDQVSVLPVTARSCFLFLLAIVVLS
jgi:hypothetical protein